MHCREKQLPHPGFLVLDSPLVTYRDPLKSKGGPLSSDEERVKATSLKEAFFEHLNSIQDQGQFIVLENVDPPNGIEALAHVHRFTGVQGEGRTGFL